MEYGATCAAVLVGAAPVVCAFAYARLPATVPVVDDEAVRSAEEAKRHRWAKVRYVVLPLVTAGLVPVAYWALVAVQARDLAARGPAEFVLAAPRGFFLLPAFITAAVLAGVVDALVYRVALGRDRYRRARFAERFRGGKDGLRFGLPFILIGMWVYGGASYLIFDTYVLLKSEEIVIDRVFGLKEIRLPYSAVLAVQDVQLVRGGRPAGSYFTQPHWVITFHQSAAWNSWDEHRENQYALDASAMNYVAQRAGIAITRVRHWP